MKCVFGFSLFWMGIGMLVNMFLPENFWVFLMIGGMIGMGYYLFAG